MVRNSLVIVLFLFVNMQLKSQIYDSLNCIQKFNYYEQLQSEKLIILWQKAPTLIKTSKIIITQLNNKFSNEINDFIVISIIIDKEGIPICFKFIQNTNSKLKRLITQELLKIRFIPAIVNDQTVESTYSIMLRNRNNCSDNIKNKSSPNKN